MTAITQPPSPASPGIGVDFTGEVTPRFRRVVDAAASNITTGDDLGFQLAVWHDGDLVIDVAAGHVDRGRTRRQTTNDLAMTFSVSKGVLGLCVALLVEEGALDLDRPVVDYWPEFGAAGKQSITFGCLLSHRAGLPAFDRTISVTDLIDWDLCIARLAQQAPVWDPGTRHGYHPLTIGYLVGEVIHRVSGLRPAEFFRQQIGDPMSIDAWFGVPAAELGRMVPQLGLAPAFDDDGWRAQVVQAAPSYVARASTNPVLSDLDVPEIWQADIPAISFVSNAAALARCYSIALAGPQQLISAETLRAVTSPVHDGHDHVLLDQASRFGGIFQMSSPRQPMLGPTSFGHDGYTGSIAFADPESRTAVAYLASRPDLRPTPHSRVTRVLAALREAL
ncbi:hypothetical protein ASE12_04305 [Aeromicrobium sp. Root236]|uniref:serine hydrolase domain-containing protein n=1 Tax=Aeromicrobium sp. Root236 TaxID=1736498 RepID=UPI0007021590|nr:serine hydrolase domain-containing protein [Aeromicrobium sp. Root236]KRC64050.1 hypothetical protein ASE12_04305 [Aeromicrobium sp. Root236]